MSSPHTQETIENKTFKIDGIVIVGEDLGFATLLANFFIPYPLFVTKVTCNHFRGVNILKSQEPLYLVNFGFINNYKCFIVLKDIGWESSSTSFERLIDVVESALDKTYLDCENTETGELYECSLWPHKKKRGGRTVVVTDLKIFTKTLIRNIRLAMPSFGNVFFVVMSTGQTTRIENILPYLHTFNLGAAIEIVLHVAVDLSFEGHGLFWKKEFLKNKQIGLLTAEYYPLMVANAGNFYLDCSMESSSRNVQIHTVKFYGEGLKHVHLLDGPPFKVSEIGPKLWKIMMQNPTVGKTKEIKDITNLQTICKAVLANTNQLLKKNELEARVEFFVSAISPSEDSPIKMIEYTKLIFNQWTLDMKNNFKVKPIDDIKENVRCIFLPSLYTVLNELDRCLSAVNNFKQYVVETETFLNICACEAICCCYIYGNTFHSLRGKSHNSKLCRILGITSRQLSQPSYCFETIKQFVTMNDDGSLKLYLRDQFIPELLNVDMIGEYPLGTFGKKIKLAVGSNQCRSLAREYLFFVIKRLYLRATGANLDLRTPMISSQQMKRNNMKPLSAFETIAELTKCERPIKFRDEYIVICNNIIRKVLDEDEYYLWMSNLSLVLENLMFKEASTLTLAVNENKAIVCIPFSCFTLQTSAPAHVFTVHKAVIQCMNNNIISAEDFSHKWQNALNYLNSNFQTQMGRVCMANMLKWVLRWKTGEEGPPLMRGLFF